MTFIWATLSLISIALFTVVMLAAWPSMPVVANILLALLVLGIGGSIIVGLRYLWIMANVHLIKAGYQPVQFPNLTSLTIGANRGIEKHPGGMSVTELGRVAPELGIIPEPITLPEPLTAVQALEIVGYNQLTWCFGTDEEGAPVTTTIPNAVHVLNIASTNMGKTTLTANLLLQLVRGNDESQYSLFIADLKRTLINPFEPWCAQTASQPAEYVGMMRFIADLVMMRQTQEDFTAPLVLLVLEEALAVKMMLDPQALTIYANALSVVATLGREYNVFMLMCNQVDYSSKEFRASRGQFMTRVAGAFLPSAASSMGFSDKALINRLWREKVPGQFLMETIDGAKVIRTPRLDLKGGELKKLLPPVSVSKQQTVSTDSPTAAENASRTPYTPQPSDTTPANDMHDTPLLAASQIITNQELFQVYDAVRSGKARTSREVAQLFEYSKTKAAGIMRKLRELGYIIDDPNYTKKEGTEA